MNKKRTYNINLINGRYKLIEYNQGGIGNVIADLTEDVNYFIENDGGKN